MAETKASHINAVLPTTTIIHATMHEAIAPARLVRDVQK